MIDRRLLHVDLAADLDVAVSGQRNQKRRPEARRSSGGSVLPGRARARAAREAGDAIAEALLVGELLHDLLPLVEGQDSPPVDASALQADGREEDARVQRGDLVVLEGDHDQPVEKWLFQNLRIWKDLAQTLYSLFEHLGILARH